MRSMIFVLAVLASNAAMAVVTEVDGSGNGPIVSTSPREIKVKFIEDGESELVAASRSLICVTLEQAIKIKSGNERASTRLEVINSNSIALSESAETSDVPTLYSCKSSERRIVIVK